MVLKKSRLRTMIYASVVVATALLCNPIKAQAQSTKLPNLDSSLNNFDDIQLQKYAKSVGNNTQSLSNKVKAANDKELADMQKQEAKLNKRLYKVDSTLAKKMAVSSATRFQKLQTQLQKNASLVSGGNVSTSYKEYIPLMDTLNTSMKFLQTKSSNLPIQSEATKAISSINGLQTQFANAAAIKNYLNQQNQELTATFSKYGMGKQLTAYKVQAYYYKQQVQEYKEVAKDPSKMEEKAIGVLTKLPVFQSFMQKNSQLASLFPTPENYGTAQALVGLQTRASVQQLLQSKFGSTSSPLGVGGGAEGGDNSGAGSFVTQQLQGAQTQLSALKDKVNGAKNGSYSNAPSGGDTSLAGFKPNSQRTKSFWKRLEFGANIQSQRPNNLLPVTSNMAATVGYKLNDRNTIGIGASYNMGWGNGINHMALSTQGVGIRSYWDMKVKNGLSITGGYEKTYMPTLQEKFTLFYSHKNWSLWRPSALIGITKKVTITKSKSSTVQLFYDLLNTHNHIQTQPLVFRVGWGF